MAETNYDAVVIGGGHHGTIVACYLGKAGLKVAVLERHTAFGGGAISEEGPAPGFRQNPCAHFTRFYGHPAYEDFKLRDEGLQYVFPEQNEGMIFDDGSSFIGYSAYRVVDAATGRAVLDPALAEERAERRQVGQPESSHGEHDAGDRQPPATAVQPGLVHRAQPVQHDAYAEEQRGLDESVAATYSALPAKPRGVSSPNPARNIPA